MVGEQGLALENNPDLLALHRLNPDRYPYLLQSTLPGGDLGRYDILFAFPGETIEQHPGQQLRFLDRLQASYQQLANKESQAQFADLPFRGGWFLFLSYELSTEIEKLPAIKAEMNTPLALATRIPAAVVYDHQTSRSWIVVEPDAPDNQLMIDAIRSDCGYAEATIPVNKVTVATLIEETAEIYLEAVAKAKEYIREGDIFQANLSRQWVATLNNGVTPDQVFARLRQSNPSPFAGLVRINDSTSIISSSPERLLEVRGNRIRTRPIAGTYPRKEDPAEDARQSTELLAHPKERAEHIMLIDLERNDLGRVCEPGSVQVPELMSLETYRHVHHIVSEVNGKLRSDVSPTDIIAATFPGGTITGCPKVRCMEIIAELEQGTRGAYTGSMGYLNRNGSMDLNILIRTMTQNGNQLGFRAGAGIVADSSPERELAETRAKAEGLIRALR